MEQSLLYLKELTAGYFVKVLEEDFANGEIIDDLYDEGNLKFKDKPSFKKIDIDVAPDHSKIEFQDKSGKIIKLDFQDYLYEKVLREVEIIKKEAFTGINSMEDFISKKKEFKFLQNQFGILKKLWKYDDFSEYSSILYVLIGSTFSDMENLFRTDSDSIKSKTKRKGRIPIKKDSTLDLNKKSEKYFTWNKSDTDLLELITALIESKAINNSTKDLTRKEAIEAFSQFFNLEIRDAESKLSRATTRTNPTKFIDELKKSLENYIDKKFD